MNFGYQDWGAGLANAVAQAQEAERLGYDSVWTAEAYGTDCITPLTWLLAHTERIRGGSAIMQMPARTPAMTAMTAATLDLMSGGRFQLGLGLSGPQVVEGWHGQPYGKPLAKTREYVEIVRTILRREEPLEHRGDHYEIPYAGTGATGLGKPLKIIGRPRADLPIYIAAIGPKNVELAAEIADGWLPIFFSPYRLAETYGAGLEAGFAKAGDGKSRTEFDIAPSVTVLVGDDVDALRGFVKPVTALYVGGMGARGRNFYNDLACRFGYEAAAKEIQDLYLDGKKQEATAAVPDELVDEIALVGPEERIAERLEPWREAGVTTMIVLGQQPRRSASWPSSRSEPEEANARTQRDSTLGRRPARRQGNHAPRQRRVRRSVLVLLALRRGNGNEPRRAYRRRPRRLLLDGAVRRARARRPCSDVDRDRGPGPPRARRQRLSHLTHRALHHGRCARHRRRRLPRAGRDRQEELSRLPGTHRRGHPARRTTVGLTPSVSARSRRAWRRRAASGRWRRRRRRRHRATPVRA